MGTARLVGRLDVKRRFIPVLNVKCVYELCVQDIMTSQSANSTMIPLILFPKPVNCPNSGEVLLLYIAVGFL